MNKEKIRKEALELIKETTDTMWGIDKLEDCYEAVHYIGGIVDLAYALCEEIDKE